MSLIEGVGDEVTVIFSVFIVLCLVLLAWFSTHTRDIPFVSVIVLELSQRRSRNRNVAEQQANQEQARDTQGAESISAAENVESSAGVGEDGTGSNNNADTNSDSAEEAASGEASKNNFPESFSTEHCPENITVAKVTTREGTVSEMAAVDVTQQNLTETIQTVPIRAENEPSDSTELRQRRVTYFESAQGAEINSAQAEIESIGAESENRSEGPHSQQEERVSLREESHCDCSLLANSRTSDRSPTPPIVPSGEYSPHHAGPPEESTTAAVAEQSEGERKDDAESVDAGEQQIRVRLKYLNDTQRLVYSDPQETIGNFRRLHFSSELGDNKIVRFIFNGQDLRNDLSTLRAYNIADNSVVHCLITQSRQNEPNAGTHVNAGDEEVQMGNFLFPVFALVLGLVWYMRFSYKQYFTAMTTVSLAAVSFIFILAAFSSFRNQQQRRRHLD